MAYIGTSPSNGVRRRFVYEATASQTSFSGSDENGVTLTYVDSLYLDVFQNGIKLKAGDDYTATTGTTVVLVQGASANDVVEMVAFDVFSVGDTVSAKDGGSFAGNVAMAGTLSVTGDITLSNIAGGAVFNEAGADVDFRVESDNNANMLFVDGGNDKVGIGIVPTARLSLPAQASGDSGVARLAIESAVDSNDFTIAQYEDGNGTYTQIGQNISLTSDGNVSILDSGHKTAGITFDGRNNGALLFQTGGDNANAERMRIDSSGALFINRTSTYAYANGSLCVEGTGGNPCLVVGTAGTSAYNNVVIGNGNGNVGSISTNGSATAYNTSSDYRLKENVTTSWDATTRLKQLKPSRFNFIADADTTVDGFLAHEVQEIVPEAINGTKDAVEVWQDGEELPDGVSVGDNKLDDDGNTIPVMQGIDQSKLVPLLVKTIQELEARITALENA
jgi:hypothetical protein